MTRINIKGINTVRKQLANGSVRIHRYHRATGLPLEGEPGSGEFIASYAKAEETVRARHSGEVFKRLVHLYTGSVEFEQKLATSTQSEYKRMLTKAEPEFGLMPIAAIEDARVRRDFLDWREKIAKTSGDARPTTGCPRSPPC